MHGHALEHATEALQGDEEFVMAAVQENGHAFEDATEALQGDEEVVMPVVQEKQYGIASYDLNRQGS